MQKCPAYKFIRIGTTFNIFRPLDGRTAFTVTTTQLFPIDRLARLLDLDGSVDVFGLEGEDLPGISETCGPV